MIKPFYENNGSVLYNGDWIEIMKQLPDNSVTTVITDPPAGISFMGKSWDSDKGGRDKWIAWLTEGMRECLRVLKPGGIALVWAIPRTSHWTATAIEDAGFEIRDKIYHVFGQGFPKSADISKMLDKMKDAKRKIVGIKPGHEDFANRGNLSSVQSFKGTLGGKGGFDRPWMDDPKKIEKYHMKTAPATPEAQRFAGYGTGLKPSIEEWVLAMKPLDGTFAENALKHGIAGLNIDGGKIGAEIRHNSSASRNDIYGQFKGQENEGRQTRGRYPSNLLLSHHPECRETGVKKIKNPSGSVSGNEPSNPALNVYGQYGRKAFDKHSDKDGIETVEAWECVEGCPVRILDEQSGRSKNGVGGSKRESGRAMSPNGRDKRQVIDAGKSFGYGDSGGASRFFYTAKASRTERELGLKGHIPCVKCGSLDTDWHLDEKGEKVKCVRNPHPTVKPQAIIDYLVKLTQTPDGETVLDPFMGTGKTGIACVNMGRKFIGIENEPKYVEISKWAIEAAGKNDG